MVKHFVYIRKEGLSVEAVFSKSSRLNNMNQIRFHIFIKDAPIIPVQSIRASVKFKSQDGAWNHPLKIFQLFK